MQTPWGDIAIRDAHVHFFSHRFYQLLTGGRDAAQVADELGWEAPPAEPELLAKHWTMELDRHNVAAASLIASVPGDEQSVQRAVASFPDRLYGQFMLNPLAQDAVGRLRAGFGGGLHTVCLFPAMHGYSMAAQELEPLWNECAGRNVFVHCGVLSVGIRKKLGLPSPFDMRYSNPVDIHAVALRHPGIRFVVPHFGAGYFREVLMLAGLCSNVYLDTSSSNGWMKFAEVPLNLETVFRRALDVAGPKRLLFGTDSSFFPRGWVAGVFEEQVRVLQAIGINADDAASIFGGNLARINS